MARPRSSQLSSTHGKIAKAIAKIEREGFPVLVSELVRELRLAGNSSLVPTLRIMQRNGFISIHGGGGHGRDQWVKLTPKGRFAVGEGGLPVLGTIRAGLLEEVMAEPEAILENTEILPHQPGDFLLRVRGDSMIGDGILPGDYVLLRPNVEVARGEIAAVLVGSEGGEFAGECEATLKRVYLEGEKLRLKASNPKYPEVRVPAGEVKIAGVFRGLIRYAGKI